MFCCSFQSLCSNHSMWPVWTIMFLSPRWYTSIFDGLVFFIFVAEARKASVWKLCHLQLWQMWLWWRYWWIISSFDWSLLANRTSIATNWVRRPEITRNQQRSHKLDIVEILILLLQNCCTWLNIQFHTGVKLLLSYVICHMSYVICSKIKKWLSESFSQCTMGFQPIFYKGCRKLISSEPTQVSEVDIEEMFTYADRVSR